MVGQDNNKGGSKKPRECNLISKTPKTKEKIKAAEKSLCDQSWDEKARMKKEEKACQLVVGGQHSFKNGNPGGIETFLF